VPGGGTAGHVPGTAGDIEAVLFVFQRLSQPTSPIGPARDFAADIFEYSISLPPQESSLACRHSARPKAETSVGKNAPGAAAERALSRHFVEAFPASSTAPSLSSRIPPVAHAPVVPGGHRQLCESAGSSIWGCVCPPTVGQYCSVSFCFDGGP
jgi:hypothetical protein